MLIDSINSPLLSSQIPTVSHFLSIKLYCLPLLSNSTIKLKVYLSGKIHSDWRAQIIEGYNKQGLEISFSSAVTNHYASDTAGDGHGVEANSFCRDHESA
ncbi:YtoQ family protein [Microbulbifer sp. PSTR4-B]|uniref:YtoQ family protein n=1 Tax=Microbulbifer sp. PSTR4-B TaxID=3243396 RepID=UPI00403A6C62